jgi:Protein of unknown function (DUF429)
VYAADGRFPAEVAGTERLRLRATDLDTLQRAGWPAPLSVSTDRIGVCAIRCARLLTALLDGRVDRTGGGLAVEVYPAAALRLWGLPARGYKGPSPTNAGRRAGLVDAFLAAAAPWLAVESAEARLMRGSDHAFDALVAAVVARARLLGRTAPIPSGSLEAAQAEGWIHLPEPGPLAALDPFRVDGKPGPFCR